MKERTKLVKKTNEQLNQQSTLKKTGTRMFERAEIGIIEPLGTATPRLINNAHFSYDRGSPTNNDNGNKQHFLQHHE